METILFVLKIISGVGIICLFVFLVLYTLDKNSSRFLKYLLSYLIFLGAIAFLFFVFPDATPTIALLAGLGWIALIVKGSRGGKDTSSEDDLE
jgi:hypothetical protein